MTGRIAARAARVAGVMAVLLAAAGASAGPVEVYRTGPQFCPHDRPPSAPAMTEAEAIERARSLLPPDFCGPGRFVSGCNAEPEWEYGAWRIFIHQYKQVDARQEQLGLDHSYVILDRVGNCLANIPGTELGSKN